MKIIDMEHRTAQEVFEELKHRLDSTGHLPDEYFLLDSAWENGEEVPEGADIFCTTDYGGSEGVYLDVYLKWYADGKPVIKNFITGKTLGEHGSDLDRMFLISSAITKAFHGDRGTYARTSRLGERPEPESMILHLNPDEQRQLIGALVEQRERLVEHTDQTEQLLRRMTGSILRYMDEVGQRPLRVSSFDKTMLAIQDGDLYAFKEVLPAAIDHADELLIAAAGRPGVVGERMCVLVHAAAHGFSEEAYLEACQNAVQTGSTDRVRFLLEQILRSVPTADESLYGKILQAAYREKPHMGRKLIQNSTTGQLAAAPPVLLYNAAAEKDFSTALKLVDSGIQAEPYGEPILRTLTGGNCEWMAVRLLKHGMTIGNQNFPALYACVQNDAPDVAKLLLDQGMDFNEYKQWAAARGRDSGMESVMHTLTAYWDEMQEAQMAEEEPSQGYGMEMSL